MELKKECKVRDIKKYLKSLENESKTFQLKKIINMLNFLELEYTILKSANGYNIIEVYELYFIIETEKSYKLVKI